MESLVRIVDGEVDADGGLSVARRDFLGGDEELAGARP
jgi:hypothetical protein